jgi:hypothetical protein
MSQPLPDSAVFLLAGAGLIFLVLLGIITWSIRIGFRSQKSQLPKWKSLFFIAFLQVLLGSLVIITARVFHNDPWIDIGAGLGAVILSGLFFIKLVLKNGWNLSLRVWVVSALLQMLLVSICAGILAVSWVMLYYLLYPPRL